MFSEIYIQVEKRYKMEVQDKLNLNVTVTVLRISYKQHIF